MADFQIGDRVKWISSNVGKIGEIVAIVPVRRTPSDVGFPKAGGGGLSRDHVSYVIKGRKLDTRGKPYGSRALYWPFVSLIEAAPAEAPAL